MKPTDEEYLRALDHSIKEIGRGGFQQEVTDGFRMGGYELCYHTHNSRHSPAGFPDVIVPMMLNTLVSKPFILGSAWKNQLVVVELKAGDNKPSSEQIAWLEALKACEAMTFCLWPRHRPVLNDLYAGNLGSRRVMDRLHVYTKRG